MSDFVPSVPEDIVKFLRDRFPPRDFTTSETLREIDFYSGQREVVLFLERLLEDQVESSFTA
tara:strand:+ start:462 stop:647 length:186 start_codon:yes stop_codon:yes gene_type:complete